VQPEVHDSERILQLVAWNNPHARAQPGEFSRVEMHTLRDMRIPMPSEGGGFEEWRMERGPSICGLQSK